MVAGVLTAAIGMRQEPFAGQPPLHGQGQGIDDEAAPQVVGHRPADDPPGVQALEGQGTDAFPGQGNPPAVEEELRRLRAENKRLLAERDILKKAAAFFAKEAL